MGAGTSAWSGVRRKLSKPSYIPNTMSTAYATCHSHGNHSAINEEIRAAFKRGLLEEYRVGGNRMNPKLRVVSIVQPGIEIAMFSLLRESQLHTATTKCNQSIRTMSHHD